LKTNTEGSEKKYYREQRASLDKVSASSDFSIGLQCNFVKH